ncbi:macrosialin [Mauremys mutica]|uniref:macrosialin n=1 Tax=Mauremys mutica TaxID=74926 RepID=UPI001D157D6D|nr:macrosialin [Mauremys mutica]
MAPTLQQGVPQVAGGRFNQLQVEIKEMQGRRVPQGSSSVAGRLPPGGGSPVVHGSSWGTESPESSAPSAPGLRSESAGVRHSHEPIRRGVLPPPGQPTGPSSHRAQPHGLGGPGLSVKRRTGREGDAERGTDPWTDGRSSMGTLGTLCLLLCLAVCISAPPGEGSREPTTPGSGMEAPCDGDGCPRHKKSATLVPSFTKTTPTTTTHRTTPPTTTHRTKPPTTTHPANHTTTHRTTPPTTTHRTKPPTTTHPANHTTTHRTTPPTTTHRTKPPTTTHPANHTTTHPANHTTTHHTTPPTTTHPTNHTTTRPANHTTVHTTPHLTTAAPPVPPDVGVGNYSVWNGSEVCLRVQSGLQIWVRYESSSKAQLWGNFTVQPNQTKVSGNCSDQSATMELNFPQGFLHFTFVKNKTQNTVYLHEVRAQLRLQFPGTSQRQFGAHNASLREFEARLGHSYQCQNRSLALTPAFHLDALHERLQAFALPGGHFGEAELCPEERRSSLVPVIVVVVLLILILIIVIAYLVGRRRAQGGYQPL